MSENQKPQSALLTTPIFRVSYPWIAKPQPEGDMGGGYGLTALFKIADLSEQDKVRLKAMKQAGAAALQEKFGAKAIKDGKIAPGFKSGFRNGNEKPDTDGYGDGVIFSRFRGFDRKPDVVDSARNTIDGSAVYAGCYARASVRVRAYDQSGNKGIAFDLVNVMFIRDGEAFSATAVAGADDFGDLSEDELGKGFEQKGAADDGLDDLV